MIGRKLAMSAPFRSIKRDTSDGHEQLATMTDSNEWNRAKGEKQIDRSIDPNVTITSS
jgi:hypothetical protein